MDLVHQYISEKVLSKTELNQINMVRQWKEMYLPIELLGSRVRILIKAYDHINKKSIIKW